jgi:hypothetical protein
MIHYGVCKSAKAKPDDMKWFAYRPNAVGHAAALSSIEGVPAYLYEATITAISSVMLERVITETPMGE